MPNQNLPKCKTCFKHYTFQQCPVKMKAAEKAKRKRLRNKRKEDKYKIDEYKKLLEKERQHDT